MRKVRFFAFLICVLVLFNALPFVVFAETQQNIITEQKAELKKADVPELLSFEQARESGHMLRLYSKEESNTVVFQNQDGTETVYLFDENIKYTDKDGKTLDKSNKLTEISEGTFKNLSNDISVTYPKHISDGVSVEHKDFALKLVPVTSLGVKQAGSFKENDTRISYAGAFGSGTKLVYTQTFSGFKEDIILSAPPLKNAFEFWVYTESTLLKDSSGRVAAYNDNEKIGEFGDIVIYDSNDVYAFGTTELEYVKEGVYKLTINVPAEYLADENRAYPVTVDPTLTLRFDADSFGFNDATLYTEHNKCYADSNLMFVGNYDLLVDSSVNYRGIARSIINFEGLYTKSTVQYYYTANRIASVELMLKAYYAPAETAIQAYHIGGRWDEDDVESKKDSLLESVTLFYGNSIDTSVNIDTCIPASCVEYAFDITHIVMSQLADGTMPRHGVMLKATDESKAAVGFSTSESGATGGYSSGRPYIKITCTDAMPAIETTGIESGETYNITNTMTNVVNNTEYDVAIEYRNAGLCLYGHSPGNTAQAFTITYESNGKYVITQVSSGRRLAANGEYVTLETAKYSDLQRWYIIPSGNGYKFVNAVYKLKQINIPNVGVVGLSNSTTDTVWKIQRKLAVPLYVQKDDSACGYACATMVAHYFGCTSVTQTDMENKAKQLSYPGEERYAYAICNALNYYLTQNSTGISYSSSYIQNYTLAQYEEMIMDNISNGYPVIVRIKVPDNLYFPYPSTEGHYVVIVGFYYDTALEQYMAIVNDPYITHSGVYTLPTAALLNYGKIHQVEAWSINVK